MLFYLIRVHDLFLILYTNKFIFAIPMKKTHHKEKRLFLSLAKDLFRWGTGLNALPNIANGLCRV